MVILCPKVKWSGKSNGDLNTGQISPVFKWLDHQPFDFRTAFKCCIMLGEGQTVSVNEALV
jgi:hypothetical protein